MADITILSEEGGQVILGLGVLQVSLYELGSEFTAALPTSIAVVGVTSNVLVESDDELSSVGQIISTEQIVSVTDSVVVVLE